MVRHRSNPRAVTGGGAGWRALSGPIVAAAVLLFAAAGSAGGAALDTLPRTLDLDSIRSLAVQHDGRWMPLDTLARDYVESVTGDVFFAGRDPVLLLLAWTFAPEQWGQAPLIGISNAQLRKELELPQDRTVFSHDELIGHKPLMEVLQELSKLASGKKPDPLQSKAGDISEKLMLLQQVFGGEAIRPIPDAGNVQGRWKEIETGGRNAAPAALATPWTRLAQAFKADDAAAFGAAAAELQTALAGMDAAYRPTAGLLATELRYNRLHPFRTGWKVMFIGTILAGAAMVVRKHWFDGLALLGMVAGFGVLTYGLSLRWQIAGRIPAANMYESLLFLSWGMGAFAILATVVARHRLIPLQASAMGALALMLADVLPLDSFIRPIAPVLLDTIWMSIHVPEIMVSYSVLTCAVLIAHVQVVAMALAPGRRAVIDAIDRMHYWYMAVGSWLLVIGIITGSMWAASSWGRYWGWDPKEVWSLVAFLGYMVILHVRVDRSVVPGWMRAVALVLGVGVFILILSQFAPFSVGKAGAFAGAGLALVFFALAKGQFATAIKSILAFWLIIMTYVGVNYVLGIGLHSYAFGTGAVVHYMFRLGSVDLALIAVCALVYLLRAPRYGAAFPAAARSTVGGV